MLKNFPGRIFSPEYRAERRIESLQRHHAALWQTHRPGSGVLYIPVLDRPDIVMDVKGFEIPFDGMILRGVIMVPADPKEPVLITETKRSPDDTTIEEFRPEIEKFRFHRGVLKAASRGVKAYRAGLDFTL